MLKEVMQQKHLGIWEGEKFTFICHVGEVKKELGNKTETKPVFQFFAEKKIVEAVLHYGDVVYRMSIKSLDSVLNSAIGFISDDSYGTYHCTLYEHTGINTHTHYRNTGQGRHIPIFAIAFGHLANSPYILPEQQLYKRLAVL